MTPAIAQVLHAHAARCHFHTRLVILDADCQPVAGMFAVPADKMLAGACQPAAQQVKTPGGQLQGYNLLVHQLQTITAPQIEKALTIHIFLGRIAAAGAPSRPGASKSRRFFPPQIPAGFIRRPAGWRESARPIALDGDLQGLAPRTAAQRQLQVADGQRLTAHTRINLSWLARAWSSIRSASSPAVSVSTNGGRRRIR